MNVAVLHPDDGGQGVVGACSIMIIMNSGMAGFIRMAGGVRTVVCSIISCIRIAASGAVCSIISCSRITAGGVVTNGMAGVNRGMARDVFCT